MKLKELLDEIALEEGDPKEEYEVVTENDRGNRKETYRVRWDYNAMQVVIDIDSP